MKLQTTKKLFAFIIIMMFSFSFLNAQCPTCKGDKIGVYRYYGDASFCCVFETRCIRPRDVDAFLNDVRGGWHLCNPSIVKNSYIKPTRPLAKTSAEDAIASNKILGEWKKGIDSRKKCL